MTGDTLTTLEYVTRQAQLALRSPWFLLAFNAVTLAFMLLGWREQWNYLASWLAIMVEWIVGTFMFGQGKRDSVVMRETRAIGQRLERVTAVLLKDVEEIECAVLPDSEPFCRANRPCISCYLAATRTDSRQHMDVHADNGSSLDASDMGTEEGSTHE